VNKKIVVVEDDPDILYGLKLMLESAGYLVDTLSSGKALLGDNFAPPDIFILDKRMPEMDGLDLCRALKRKPETSNTPIIIISASPKFGIEAKEAGADEFLAKPFEMIDLLNIVHRYS
jgi:DNA-binding response OmpR family regulator